MALPTPETQVKVASEAATNFVDHFYLVLEKRQSPAQFYVSASAKLSEAGLKPEISVNGHVCGEGGVAAYEALLAAQGGPVQYDVQSVDAHPVNPHFLLGAPDATPSKNGDKTSIAVAVSGTLKLGKGDDAVEKGFHEAFVLVPHWEAQGRRASRNARAWLIASQNFRSF